MMKTFSVIAALAAGLALQAQAVEETVLGYLNNGITVPSNTDVIVSVPLSGTPVFDSTASASTVNSLTLNGAAFTTDQYKDLYYVRIRSGVDSGLWSTIKSNNATTLFTADDVSTVVAGDSIEIVKHQTLNSIFPAALANVTFVPSTGTSAGTRKTTVNLISTASVGINRSPGSGGVFFNFSGTWRSAAAPGADAGNTVLVPQQYYVIRNGGGASQTLQVLTAGAVNSPTIATYTARAASQNDNPLATGRSFDMSLNDTGLGGSTAFMDSVGTSAGQRRDTVNLFNNSSSGLNKSAGSGGIYFRFNGTWRSATAPTVDVSTNAVLQAGSGIMIRKYPGAAVTEIWAETNNN